MSLEETRFHTLADRTLRHFEEAVDRDLGDELDVDMEGGILTIVLPGGGQYIVNKNEPLRQIWLSSPKSGAWHFNWDEADQTWLSTRHEHVELGRLLADELQRVTGTAPAL